MPEVILKEMQPVKQFSSMVSPAPAVKLVKKDSLKTKAAGLLRKSVGEVDKTVKRIVDMHTPIGVAKAGIGLIKDKLAQRKSEAGLANVRTKAAEALGKANRTRTMRNAAEKKDFLNDVQIREINKSNLPDAHKNALFEQDMRREGRVKGY